MLTCAIVITSLATKDDHSVSFEAGYGTIPPAFDSIDDPIGIRVQPISHQCLFSEVGSKPDFILC